MKSFKIIAFLIMFPLSASAETSNFKEIDLSCSLSFSSRVKAEKAVQNIKNDMPTAVVLPIQKKSRRFFINLAFSFQKDWEQRLKKIAENQSGKLESCMATSRKVIDEKPVIYLYPSTIQNVEVRLDYQGELVAHYPNYDFELRGWSVTAFPNGRLVNRADGQEYNYLFWEGRPAMPPHYDLSEGFVVRGEDTKIFLQKTLKTLGLTPKEYNEFIVYWMPKMEKNPYNLVHFAGSEYTDTAPLTITPNPDSVLRIFMVLQGMQEPVKIKEQTLKSFERKGFTVVEWGGMESPL